MESKIKPGQRFGMLVAQEIIGSVVGRGFQWKFKCDCGNEKIAIASTILRNEVRKTISNCGCHLKAIRSKANTKHGMHTSKIYHRWEKMMARCYNPNQNGWHNYGGRGITVCSEWHDFSNFYEDMGEPPEGMELDRVDNDKGYSKENCRWVTRAENNRNKRNSLPIDVKNISEQSGINAQTIYYRWKKGGDGNMLTMPLHRGVKASDHIRHGVSKKHAQNSFKRVSGVLGGEGKHV